MTTPVETATALTDQDLDTATGGAGPHQPVVFVKRIDTSTPLLAPAEVGDQVAAAFEGDPDQPIITGRIPNNV